MQANELPYEEFAKNEGPSQGEITLCRALRQSPQTAPCSAVLDDFQRLDLGVRAGLLRVSF